MCIAIKLKDSTTIETVEQFEKHFKVDAERYLGAHYYRKPKDCSCLCPVDIERFMSCWQREEFMRQDDGDWQEI